MEKDFSLISMGKHIQLWVDIPKTKKRLINIEISSFYGLCGGAIHYYATLYINVANVCDNSSVSGYLGGIEIPNEYQTIKGEFVRPLTLKEIDEQPRRWDFPYQEGDLVNAFESLEEIENLIKKLKKKTEVAYYSMDKYLTKLLKL
nr:hypothetical protein [uncultured Prevotella sp.]